MIKIFASLFFSLFFFSAQSQITKDNWLVGGNATISSTKSVTSSVSNSTRSYIRVVPNIGYFFLNQLAGGFNGVLQHETLKFGSSPTSKQTYFGVGPFARYYFLSPERQANIFSEINYQFYVSNPGNNNSSSYSISAGTVLFFNSSVGLEFIAAFSQTNHSEFDLKTNVFRLGIGFQIHLEK